MSRKVLTLERRLEVVKHLENGKSSREIAQIMGVGRTQIQTINKRKAEILEDYENNISSDRKRKRHKTGNEEINELCWTWFQDVVQRRINVTGPLLKEMALKISADLKIDSFKASNGWLDCFIKHHNRY
jgi:kinesin family protein 6/9